MSTVEFSLNMTCGGCVAAAERALSGVEGVESFQVDLKSQAVTVTTSLPTSSVQALLEANGKRAVVVGMGHSADRRPKNLGAAVAAIGGTMGIGSVKGTVQCVYWIV